MPQEPPGGVTAGLDWARDDHAVSVVDDRGRELDRVTMPHSAPGLRDLIAFLRRHGVGEVAIERPDGPVVDALLLAGLAVVVISPNQVKNLRGRYGSAGNKDDRFDAFVLADTLRTDRARLRALIPDTDATVALRRACRARKDLVNHRVAVANQLRAHLRNVLPAAVGLFKDIDSAISLAFLTRFDTQDKIDWLTPKRLGDWLAKQGYSGKVDPAVLHHRILDAAPGATGSHGSTQAHITLVNPWAADLYDRARTRGHDHPHAVRILARAWLHIIWHCWQDNLAYAPDKHRALQRILTQNEAA
ncbi:IS110 family transposase [Mycobacterium malmoense]|uniref:IS110 family transposase n=1 Tax=Mycobacterium malmoense TaxID=1780 RepID=UPI003D9C988B